MSENKRGPKPIEIDLALVEECAELGMTEDAIASCCGVSRALWYQRKAKNVDIVDALNRGRSKSQKELLEELKRRAKADMNPASLFFALKAIHHFRDSSSLELTGPGGSAIQMEHTPISAEEAKERRLALKAKLELDDE